MKRRFEDRLAKLAFGDLSLEESMELEMQVSKDPKRAAELKEFRTLKEDLRSLADIPDHQLSNERLRDAILGQGLKPQPVENNGWSWLWMPAVSCCAAALLLMVYRNHQPVPVQVVDNAHQPAIASASGISLKTAPPMVRVAVVKQPKILKPTLKQPHSTLVVQNERLAVGSGFRLASANYRGIHGRGLRGYDPNWLATMLSGPRPGADTDTSAPSQGRAPQPSKVALVPVDSKTSDPQLVVIGTDKDEDTGAQTATEVGSAKNVVVGG